MMSTIVLETCKGMR